MLIFKLKLAIKGGMKGKVVGIDSCVEHLNIFKEEANKLENNRNVEVKTICGYYPLKETILKGEVSTVLASLIFHFLCPEDLRKGLKQVKKNSIYGQIFTNVSNFYYNNLALDFATIELFFYYSGKIVTNAIRQQFFYFKKEFSFC